MYNVGQNASSDALGVHIVQSGITQLCLLCMTSSVADPVIARSSSDNYRRDREPDVRRRAADWRLFDLFALTLVSHRN